MIKELKRLDFLKHCAIEGNHVTKAADCISDMDLDIWHIDDTHESCPDLSQDISHIGIMGSVEILDTMQESFLRGKYGVGSARYQTSMKYLEAERNKPKAKQQQKGQAAKMQEPDIGEGVGTELKKMLSMIGLRSGPHCSCNEKAKKMNDNGIQWCKDNKSTILGWLEEEAKKRKLPFLKFGANKIINFAIHRADKKGYKK